MEKLFLFLQVNSMLVQYNWRIYFSLAVGKLSFPLILPTGKISFSIFFNPLINFQGINIFWKIFSFLQLNIMSVQNHWRMYFSFAAENICSISWILPTGKITFHIFFDIFFIFQKLAITGKEKTDLDSFPFFGPTGKTSSARLSPRAQAAPRPQPGPGPANCRGALPPPGPLAGPCIQRRWIWSDGHPIVLAE